MAKVHEYFPYIEDGEVPFVAHNKAFDENCLKAVFAAYEVCYPDYEFECTLLKSRKVWQTGHHNLDIIAGYCGYDLTNHHHALDAKRLGLSLIAAGHYATEFPVTAAVAAALRAALPEVEVLVSTENRDPYTYL